jgi:hypothetical protein
MRIMCEEPGALDDFVNEVVPELQRRNLFREYETGPCAKTSACRGQGTVSLRNRVSKPEHRWCRLKNQCLPFAHGKPFDLKSRCGANIRAV